MIAEKEKAHLCVQIIEKFAPHMDDSTDLFKQMGEMITGFGLLVESFSELPEDKKIIFMNFIRLFNNYIEHASTNYNDLRGFYSFMTVTTNTSISAFRTAIGVE